MNMTTKECNIKVAITLIHFIVVKQGIRRQYKAKHFNYKDGCVAYIVNYVFHTCKA